MNRPARMAGGLAAAVFVVIAMATLGAAGMPTSSQASCGASSVTGSAPSGLPAAAHPFADLYVEAAARYELGRRGPAVLASIHEIESGFGENQGPSSAGALGQMQFMPATWATYGLDADRDGRADPASAPDAIFTAARYLAASGAPGDWHAAVFAYNHADWYVRGVLEEARRFGQSAGAEAGAASSCASSQGPFDLNRAVRVYEPARDQRVPERFIASGTGPIVVDARIWPNIEWVLGTYGLVLTAGKETGHASHGDGSAIDAVPAEDAGSLAHWADTAGRLASDLGWTPACAQSGVRPSCGLAPAVEFVGYNGYDSHHGDPAHSQSPHIHVSWVSSTHGTAYLTTPEWMLAFAPATPSAASTDGNDRVLVIGDSLTVGDGGELKALLGSRLRIDAATGRASTAGVATLRGTLRSTDDVIVFDLGTNDDPDRPAQLASDLREVRSIVGERCLVIATVNGPAPAGLNRVLSSFAQSDGAVLFDWHLLASSRGLLGAGEIHPDADGYRERALGELEAISSC